MTGDRRRRPMRSWAMRIPILILAAAVLAACGGGGDDGDDDGGGVFDPAVTTVRLEIDYETGEAPYTGNVIGFGDSFDLSATNLDRLFAGTKQLTIPRTTDAMQDIGVVADEELTADDLLALAALHRDDPGGGATRTYYLLFVSGQYTDDSGPRPGVLGVSIGNSGVVAMFKDVIESTGLPAVPNLERFVEQSVLIHEVGHALGLVNNGVALASAHHDSPNGAHCTNDQCVMYWLNEGASDMAMFARQYAISGDAILFDDACLGDVDALTGGP